MYAMAILYYLVAFGAPPLVTYLELSFNGKHNKEDVCKYGINGIAHLIYFIFALLSAALELYLFIIITAKVGHLLPSPVDMKDYRENKVYSKFEQQVFQLKAFFNKKK